MLKTSFTVLEGCAVLCIDAVCKVSRQKPGFKAKNTKLFTGTRTFSSYGTIRLNPSQLANVGNT